MDPEQQAAIAERLEGHLLMAVVAGMQMMEAYPEKDRVAVRRSMAREYARTMSPVVAKMINDRF